MYAYIAVYIHTASYKRAAFIMKFSVKLNLNVNYKEYNIIEDLVCS